MLHARTILPDGGIPHLGMMDAAWAPTILQSIFFFLKTPPLLFSPRFFLHSSFCLLSSLLSFA